MPGHSRVGLPKTVEVAVSKFLKCFKWCGDEHMAIIAIAVDSLGGPALSGLLEIYWKKSHIKWNYF